MGDSNYSSITTETTQLTAIASDGTHIPIEGTKTTEQKNYSIKKLNSRIYLNKGNHMEDDLFAIQAEICSSSNNIKMFREVLVQTSREHLFTMSAQRFAKLMDVTRNTASTFFKKCLDNKLLHKLDTNQYLVNPFLFTPIGAKAETIQQGQLQWSEIQLQSDLEDPEMSGLANDARKLIDEYALTKPLALLWKNEFFLSILTQYREGKKLTQKQVDALIKQFKE